MKLIAPPLTLILDILVNLKLDVGWDKKVLA